MDILAEVPFVQTCQICDKIVTQEHAYKRHVKYCQRAQSRRKGRPRSCSACRTAKAKCSFGQPCSRCQKRNVRCIYQEPACHGIVSEFGHERRIDDSCHTDLQYIEYPETSESLGTSFDFNDLMVDWVSSPSTISATQPTTVYRDMSFWNISSDLQISMPPKSLSAKGDLTRVSNRLSSLQHASRIVMQMLYSYPRMMLRRQTFPPFIHPHWHQEHLPEALGNCMSIARLFESRTPETVSFLWKTIIAEQTGFREKLGTFTPCEVHLSLQVMIIYLIMAMTDSGTENRERVATLFETVELIGSRFLDLAGSYSTSEAAEPNTMWEVWIFAESRRRMSCLWLIISCVITIENGQTHSRCDELENLALPSSKMLWEARTLDEWQMEKNIFDAGSAAMTLGELVDAMINPVGLGNSQKLRDWEAGSDNLAAMLKVVVEFVWYRVQH
ncbi:hypothetical protein NXS19_006656 [Fusarium pseudograminearum]|nr:hypothetical protein NXS19_006656 [Fusarium pseudograminearum]